MAVLPQETLLRRLRPLLPLRLHRIQTGGKRCVT